MAKNNSVNSSERVLNFENTVYTTSTSISTTIPFDDTIPENTEGTELFTASYTPSDSASKLEIIVTIPIVTASRTSYQTLALFQDSDSNALEAQQYRGRYNSAGNSKALLTLRHIFSVSSTSAITFKVRMGDSAGNTIYLNRNNTGNVYDGAMYSNLTITEYI